MEPTSTYRADIDGLRAVAVLAVVLYHFGLEALPGGFLGVDVFFVISGYLITRILVKETAATGRIDFGRFYLRRIRRLLPAMLVTVLVSSVVAAVMFAPVHLERFGSEALSSMFSVSNIFFWTESGYFDTSKQFKPLLHTWSLSVEEQFYLVWPALILLSLRATSRTGLFVVLLAVFCVSLIASHGWADRSAAFFLTPFRGFEFVIGAALVFLDDKLPNRFLMFAALVAGLSMIGWSFLHLSEQTLHPSAYTLIPAVGAALAIYGGRAPIVGLILSNPVSVWVGKISYSLYLVHWPLVIFYQYARYTPGERNDIAPHDMVGLLVAAIGCSALLHYLIEQPLRTPAPAKRNFKFLGYAAGTIAFLVAPLASMTSQSGWGWRLSAAEAKLLSSPDRQITRQSECQYAVTSLKNIDEDRLSECADRYGPAIIITGDSHSPDLLNALSSAGAHQHLIAAWRGSCTPAGRSEECPYVTLLDYLHEHPGMFSAVIWTQTGHTLISGDKDLETSISAVDEYLESLAGFGVEVIWAGPQWEPDYAVQNLTRIKAGTDYLVNERLDLLEIDRRIQFLADAGELSVEYVSKLPATEPRDISTFIIDGEFTYSDGGHWSAKGEEVFGKRLIESSPTLQRLVGARSDHDV